MCSHCDWEWNGEGQDEEEAVSMTKERYVEIGTKLLAQGTNTLKESAKGMDVLSADIGLTPAEAMAFTGLVRDKGEGAEYLSNHVVSVVEAKERGLLTEANVYTQLVMLGLHIGLLLGRKEKVN